MPRASLFLAGLPACFAAPAYTGPASDHFDGEAFRNQVPVEAKGFLSLLEWQLQAEPGEWEDRPELPPRLPPPERVGEGELRVTFINHATVLVQADGVNILTDPIYSERASPSSVVGPERHHAPGVPFNDLPPIDVVVISHNHYDHLDLETLRRLADAHAPRILVGLGNERLLDAEGIDGGIPLDWWESIQVTRDVRVHAVPSRHWSNRGLTDRTQTLWAAYVIETTGGPVYFAGDTGWGPHFEQARERFGPMRFALLPIGAYEPRWFMREFHVSPEEAVDAHIVLGAQASMAIHFGTFELGDDGMREPVETLHDYLAVLPSPMPAFWVLEPGEGRDVPPLVNAAATTDARTPDAPDRSQTSAL